MMKIHAVPADRRFDQTAFSIVVTKDRALPLITTYTCPLCSERVRFSKQNFAERSACRVSHLHPVVRELFDGWAATHGKNGKPFLDWVCAGCGLPVRVYAHPWDGGQHGESVIELSVVLEAHGES